MENEIWMLSARARMDKVASGMLERKGIEEKDEAGHQDKWQRALERL